MRRPPARPVRRLHGQQRGRRPLCRSGVLGPYSPSLPLVRASTAVKTTRTGQLLADLVRLAAGSKSPRRGWEGMAMLTGSQVPIDDPRLAAVYAHFAHNLQDI